MRIRKLAALAAAAAVALAACSSPESAESGTEADTGAVTVTTSPDRETNEEVPTETDAPETEAPETETPETEASAEETAETEAEESSSEAESAVGETDGFGWTEAGYPGVYRLRYDASLFGCDAEDSMLHLGYQGPLETESSIPAYVTVQVMDMGVDDLVNGLVLQSGDDGTTVAEGAIGADSVPTKVVQQTQEIDGTTQIQMFFVVGAGEKSVLIEVSSYAGAGEILDSAIETILGTFELIQ